MGLPQPMGSMFEHVEQNLPTHPQHCSSDVHNDDPKEAWLHLEPASAGWSNEHGEMTRLQASCHRSRCNRSCGTEVAMTQRLYTRVSKVPSSGRL